MSKKEVCSEIINYINEKIYPITLNKKGESKINILLNDFSKEELYNAIDIGYDSYIRYDINNEPIHDSVEEFLNKIGGIAHNNALSPVDQKIRHLKNIGKKNFYYWNENMASIILEDYVKALRANGWSEDAILDDLTNEALTRSKKCKNWTEWKNLFETWTDYLNNKTKETSNDENKLTISKKYKIINKIGSGSFGITYLCKDLNLNKLFVIKKFSCERLSEKENELFFDKFIREIVCLFDLHHQNIVGIYDYIIDRENNFGLYIMEYVDGCNIEEYLKEKPNSINDLFIQTIDAFFYLEKNNLCHRDIRINNILINEKSEVKLIDFGFVKDISEGSSLHSATKLISYPYDWPEELKAKNQKYDTKTEIYFVGKMFDDLINRLGVSDFNFSRILDLMIIHSYRKRISSFEEIKEQLKMN